jgi:hypothetical protein
MSTSSYLVAELLFRRSSTCFSSSSSQFGQTGLDTPSNTPTTLEQYVDDIYHLQNNLNYIPIAVHVNSASVICAQSTNLNLLLFFS